MESNVHYVVITEGPHPIEVRVSVVDNTLLVQYRPIKKTKEQERYGGFTPTGKWKNMEKADLSQ